MEKLPELMRIPEVDSEDLSGVYQRLGKPDAAEKYTMPETEGSWELSPEALGTLKAEAHSNNLTQAQFSKSIERMAAQATASNEANTNARSENDALLRTEWGLAYGDRMDLVKSFLNSDNSVPADFKQAFNDNRLAADSIKWIHGLAEMSFEGSESTVQSGTGATSNNLTPMEAKMRANEIFEQMRGMRDTDPLYKDLMHRRVEYIRMASTR